MTTETVAASGTAPNEEPLPFAGLRVIDIASFIAAPVAATILGDLGADVIKVEMPGEGDPYRQFPSHPGFQDVGVNYTWIMDNRCKRSLSLDLKSDHGRGILHRLVEGCDVYITNQPLPMREKLGLTYDVLGPLNPRMIFASLTGYGEVGPERNKSAFDQVAYWARSGLCDLVRAPGAAPVQGLAGMGDHPTGVALFAAITSALYRRERTGRGGLVHTSLLANGYWSNGCLGQAALAGVSFEARRKGEPPTEGLVATHVLYEAQDGRYVQLNMVRSDEQVEAMFRVLGLEQLIGDERFATPDSRFEHGLELAEYLREAIASRSAEAWLSRFADRGVPASHLKHVEEMIDDQQAMVNDVLLDASDTGVGMPYVVNHPVGLGDVRGRGVAPPPEVGEHSEEVLLELGYCPAEIEEFRRGGVI